MIRSPEQIAREAADIITSAVACEHYCHEDAVAAVLAAIREDRGRPVTPSPVSDNHLAAMREQDARCGPAALRHSLAQDRRDLLAHAAHQDAVIADLSRTVAAFGNDSDCFREGVREGVRRAIEVTQARMGGHLHRAAEHAKSATNMQWSIMNERQADTLDELLTDLEGLIPNETT